jgi:hypothetical protein
MAMNDQLIDELVGRAQTEGMQLTKRLKEPARVGEVTDHRLWRLGAVLPQGSRCPGQEITFMLMTQGGAGPCPASMG